MSSTNKTTNYELSQFLGSDKPAWLTDYNSDMSKIDAGVHNAQTTATGADGKATTNASAIGTLSNLTTDVKNNLVASINEVDSHADTAQNTANSAGTTANSANNTANGLVTYLNLGASNTEVTNTDMSVSGGAGSIRATSSIHIVGNSDKSLIKIYGNVFVENVTSNSNITITIANTGLTPSSNITINSCGFITKEGETGVKWLDELTYTINSNGTITIPIYVPANIITIGAKFIACVVFLKDFGDE